MIPLRDTIPSRTLPITNVFIIALNTIAFVSELLLAPQGQERLIFFLGIVPARYMGGQGLFEHTVAGDYLPFLTGMFLHGGWLHFLGNMWFLWLFGDNVEDRIGHFRYFLFYILCGILSSLVHILVNAGSLIPTIGASGAIAGVMGAYFVMYPQARIVTLIPIFFFIEIIQIPAFIFLGIWFFMQLQSGALALAGTGQSGGIAFWAHIGGFIAGILLLVIFLKTGRNRRR